MNTRWMSILMASALVLSVVVVAPTIAADTNPPSVTNPSASPATIAGDGSQYAELIVHVVDDTAIDTVTVDLTPIGGKVVSMTCKANYTEDGSVISIFNYTTNATCSPGTYSLAVNATDIYGNYNIKSISLEVVPAVTLPTASIEPETQTVGAGKSFTFNVSFDPAGDGFAGGSVEVKFNASVMQVNSVELGDIFAYTATWAPGSPVIDNVAGTLLLEAYQFPTASPPAPAGSYAVITATVNADAPDGNYSLSITKAEFGDEFGEPIPGIVVENGTITVGIVYPRWDVDADGDVDIWDLMKVAAHYGETIEAPYPRWDVDADGDVDIWDLMKVAAHYGEKY